MTEQLLIELVKQGGFAILCGVMFYVYRHDSKGWAQKQSETAQAFMAFGERTATALTQVSEAIRQQSTVLVQIDRNLNDNHLCPITQVSTEMLRDTTASDEPARRRVDALLRDALRRAAETVPREG